MKDIIYFLRYLYGLIRYRLFVWLFMAAGAAILEGAGVALFLPILEAGETEGRVAEITRAVFQFFHVKYSFPVLLAVMVTFFLLRGALYAFQELYVRRIIAKLFLSLRSEFVGKFFQSEYQFVLGKNIGSITNAATLEFQRVLACLEQSLAVVLASGFVVIYFCVPLVIDPVLTIAVIALAPFGYLVSRAINRRMRQYSIESSAARSQLQSYLIEAFQNFKYLKATHSHPVVLKKIHEVSGRYADLYYKQAVLQSVTSNSIEPLSILIVAAILLYQVGFRGGQVVEILFVAFLLRRAVMFFLSAQQSYRKILGHSGSVEIFRTFHKELDAHRENSNSQGAAPDFDQPIEFKNVSFSYGSGRPVFEGINLVIPPRTTIAFAGPSGAGKSTMAALLTGLLKPTTGEIVLGKVPYSDLDLESLRQSIGYVTQETAIFNDTIFNNITLWSRDGCEEKVRAAVAGARIKEFIEELPEGYHTLLGDNGLNISGGQRQRISIARELFKEVKLLIFDEATSSLDTQSEREIQKNIDEFRGIKTIILIAHRLSTVRHSDLIFVLKDGKIVEKGSYEQLFVLKGEFRSMVEQQMAPGPRAKRQAVHGKL